MYIPIPVDHIEITIYNHSVPYIYLLVKERNEILDSFIGTNLHLQI